jgi:hypothetical protein
MTYALIKMKIYMSASGMPERLTQSNWQEFDTFRLSWNRIYLISLLIANDKSFTKLPLYLIRTLSAHRARSRYEIFNLANGLITDNLNFKVKKNSLT